MNYLDIIIAIPLIWSVYKGFTKGFIFVLASLIALIGGLYGAIQFSGVTEAIMKGWVSQDIAYLSLISFTITFVFILVIVYLIALILDRFIKFTGLGIFNRLAGVVFNLFKMALILSVLMNIITYAGNFRPLIPEDDKENSLLFEPIRKIAPAIIPYLHFDQFKQKMEEDEPPEKRVITMNSPY
jgi:membrane protein required for colicin V production